MAAGLEDSLFTLAFVAYFVAALVFLGVVWVPHAALHRLGLLFGGAGAAVHFVSLVCLGLAAGRWPFATLYEFITVFSWVLAVFVWGIIRRYRLAIVGAVAMPVVIGLMGYASLLTKDFGPVMPALQSYWLQFHVISAVLAYSGFGLSFAFALLYLVRGRRGPNTADGPRRAWLPAPDRLEALIYGAIAFGFPFQTIMLITGAVWAEEVWGRWWGWDPKETWALITWLIYAVYLHARLTRGWSGRSTAWFAIIGFGAVLFTLVGVTWLMPGIHSY